MRVLPSVCSFSFVFVVLGCDKQPDGQSHPAPPASSRAVEPACDGRGADPFCDDGGVRVCRDGVPSPVKACAKLERCEGGKCVPSCPAGEVHIPSTGAKGFTMGRGQLKGRDQPHTVVLTKPFCMDEAEVTAGEFAKCVEAGKCEEPYKWDPWASYPRFPNQPVNLVSQEKAAAYCAWRGKQLPTEAQWEWAASGGEPIEWPWGNEEPTCENELLDFTPFGAPKSAPGGDVGCRGGGPSDVKSFPKGAKHWPSGKLYDMAGNVWEWTRDMAMPYPKEKQVDPEVKEVPNKPDNTVYVIRGGGWNRSAHGCKVWFRGEATRRYQVPGLGFRCVREL